jgi:hypothetical protein
LIFSSGENAVNRDDSDSRSRKSSDTSCGAGAAATASAEAYLRQQFPDTAVIGRASRNASRRREDGSSRKAIVGCRRGVDEPKFSLTFPAGMKPRGIKKSGAAER